MRNSAPSNPTPKHPRPRNSAGGRGTFPAAVGAPWFRPSFLAQPDLGNRLLPGSISVRTRRSAFSLLEVILALTILGLSLAVLGELARLGLRQAGYTRDMTQAQLLCESKLSEIVSGIVSPEPVVDAPIAAEDLVDPTDPVGWVYSIELAETEQPGLVAVAVTVSQNLPPERRPVRCTLVRWIPSPGIAAYDIGTEAASQALQNQSSGASSQTRSTSSTESNGTNTP